MEALVIHRECVYQAEIRQGRGAGHKHLGQGRQVVPKEVLDTVPVDGGMTI